MLTTDQAGSEAARLSSALPLGQRTILNQKQTLQTWTRRSALFPDSRNVSYSMSKKKKEKVRKRLAVSVADNRQSAGLILFLWE